MTGAPRLYDRIREILESARASVARTVNTAQVAANWLIGREIVEEEQAGKRRAVYGAELLWDLAAGLKAEFGSGYGVDNLELFRRFYLEYPRLLPEANFRRSASEIGPVGKTRRSASEIAGCAGDSARAA